VGCRHSARDPATQSRTAATVTCGPDQTAGNTRGLGVVAQGSRPRACAHNRCCRFCSRLEAGGSTAGRSGVTASGIDGAQSAESRQLLQQGQQPLEWARGVAVFGRKDSATPACGSSVAGQGQQLQDRDRTRRPMSGWRAQFVSRASERIDGQLFGQPPASSFRIEAKAQRGGGNGGTDSGMRLFSAPRSSPGAGAIMSPGSQSRATHKRTGPSEQQHDPRPQRSGADEGHRP